MKSIKERFEEKFVVDEETGCWNWTASLRGSDGYGGFSIGKKRLRANRASWLIYCSEIPDGLCVCHSCDNPLCVNPDHLFLGTQQDNMTDKVNKGRQQNSKGEQNGRAKLTEKQIINIINDHRKQKEIAKDYNVCQQHVSLIKKGKSWKHLNFKINNLS